MAKVEFQRYNSFDEDDLRQAAAQQHQFITNLAQQTLSQEVIVHKYL
jgi:hypothetical protein